MQPTPAPLFFGCEMNSFKTTTDIISTNVNLDIHKEKHYDMLNRLYALIPFLYMKWKYKTTLFYFYNPQSLDIVCNYL